MYTLTRFRIKNQVWVWVYKNGLKEKGRPFWISNVGGFVVFGLCWEIILFWFAVKADKIAEQIKTEREKQEQQTREDELREMAIKLRRRFVFVVVLFWLTDDF